MGVIIYNVGPLHPYYFQEKASSASVAFTPDGNI
jgi:hypothetical protein